MADTEEYKDLTEIKITIALPAYLVTRLRNKHNTQMPIKDFTTKALLNEFKKRDLLSWFIEELPKYMESAIMKSDMGEIIKSMADDIKPAFEMMQLNSIELKSRITLETIIKKFNLFYLIAIDQEIPKDVVSLQLIQELIDDGYLDQLPDSSIGISNRKAQLF